MLSALLKGKPQSRGKESSLSRARALPGDNHQPAFPFRAPPSCHCTVWVGIPLAQGAQESHILLCLGQADPKVKYSSWTGTTGTKAQAMTFTSNPCAGANAFSKHVDMHHWKWTMLLPPLQPFLLIKHKGIVFSDLFLLTPPQASSTNH